MSFSRKRRRGRKFAQGRPAQRLQRAPDQEQPSAGRPHRLRPLAPRRVPICASGRLRRDGRRSQGSSPTPMRSCLAMRSRWRAGSCSGRPATLASKASCRSASAVPIAAGEATGGAGPRTRISSGRDLDRQGPRAGQITTARTSQNMSEASRRITPGGRMEGVGSHESDRSDDDQRCDLFSPASPISDTR